MRNLHVFRPTAFDSLEDRVVMATGAAAASGLALTDVFLVQNEVDSAFSRFRGDISTGFFGAADFSDSPTNPNALVAPTLALFQTNAGERVNQLAQELSDVISPLRRSTRVLIPSVLAIVAQGNGSLANTVNTTVARLTTAVNTTQQPLPTTNTPAQNAALQLQINQANRDIDALRTQLFSQIESARVAVNNELRLFSTTPQGRAGRRARLDLASAQNAIRPAYDTFESGLRTAIAAVPTAPTAANPTTLTTFQNDLNNLRVQVLNLTNTLNTQLASVVGGSQGSGGSSNRVRTYVQNEINGLNSSSLLNDINDQIDQLRSGAQNPNFVFTTTSGIPSLAAFNFGISNIVAQSRLETAGLLAVGSA